MDEANRLRVVDFHLYYKNDTLFLYKGGFDKNILALFRTYIDGLLFEHPQLNKKIFAIFIEFAQNIIYYSAEKTRVEEKTLGKGVLAIIETEKGFYFETGNEIYIDEVSALVEKCQTIDSLDREGLRKYKRSQLNLPSGPNDTANIGLIQIALNSDGKLEFEITPINNEVSFVTFKIFVNKEVALH